MKKQNKEQQKNMKKMKRLSEMVKRNRLENNFCQAYSEQMGGDWNEMIFKVHSNPDHSIIQSG